MAGRSDDCRHAATRPRDLMHEAAHGGLHGHQKINECLGQWMCAVPVGADLASYRAYHLKHHKFTQQPEDPDLTLSAHSRFPKIAFFARRSAILTGQTFTKQRMPLPRALFTRSRQGDANANVSFISSGADKTLRFLAVNVCCSRCAGLPRGYLVSRRLAVRDGDVAAFRDARAEHRRTCLYLDRSGPIQPCPHHACQLDRARADRALLGELPRTLDIICSCICRATGCRIHTGC